MKKRSILLSLSAVVLTATLFVGGTFAYLSAVTDTKENKFTSEKNLDGDITEDKWIHGENGWSDYLPGESTGKNPVISIDKEGKVDAYVAMKVVCKGNDGKEISFEDFKTMYATVSYQEAEGINSTDWVCPVNTDGTPLYSDSFFVFKGTTTPPVTDPVTPPVNGVVYAGQATTPLFDTVTINTGIYRVYKAETEEQIRIIYKVDADGKEIAGTRKEIKGTVVVSEETKVGIENADGSVTEVEDAKLPSFQIDVTGYAIQVYGNEKNYVGELAKLAGL